MLLLAIALTGCSQNRFVVLDLNNEPDFPQAVFEALYVNPAEPGVYTTKTEDGKLYMAVSTGEAHQLDRHLRLMQSEYDSSTQTLALNFEQFVPGTSGTPISSWNWFPVVKFSQISAQTIKVSIQNQENVLQAEYEVQVAP